MYKNIIVANLLCMFLALQATTGNTKLADTCPNKDDETLLETLDRAIDAHNQEAQRLADKSNQQYGAISRADKAITALQTEKRRIEQLGPDNKHPQRDAALKKLNEQLTVQSKKLRGAQRARNTFDKLINLVSQRGADLATDRTLAYVARGKNTSQFESDSDDSDQENASPVILPPAQLQPTTPLPRRRPTPAALGEQRPPQRRRLE